MGTQIVLFQVFQKRGQKESLSDVQQARIVTMHEGHSERKIVVKMTCSKTAVNTANNNFELYGNYSNKKRSGHSRKTSHRDDLMMKQTVSRFSTSSCKTIPANLLQKPFLKQVSQQ